LLAIQAFNINNDSCNGNVYQKKSIKKPVNTGLSRDLSKGGIW